MIKTRMPLLQLIRERWLFVMQGAMCIASFILLYFFQWLPSHDVQAFAIGSVMIGASTIMVLVVHRNLRDILIQQLLSGSTRDHRENDSSHKPQNQTPHAPIIEPQHEGVLSITGFRRRYMKKPPPSMTLDRQ
jgi:Na+/melibiose symporter-like transporter